MISDLPEWCKCGNISYSCSSCNPKYDRQVEKLLDKGRQIQEDYKFIDEGHRCKYCDQGVLTKPSRKTYKCSVCLNSSHKEKDPTYVFPRFDWDSLQDGLEDCMSFLPMPREILKFRRERWNKIPPLRQQEILDEVANIIDEWKFYNELSPWDQYNQNRRQLLLGKVQLSEWYLEFYENWFIFLAKRPGFCKVPKKILYQGRWITE